MVITDGAAHVGGAAHGHGAAHGLSLAGAEDESALFGGRVEGSRTPLPKFASYLARVRLGAV